MDAKPIALFGEAEKGHFKTAYYCKTLTELEEHFGNPPPHTRGLHYAIQALMYDYDLLFFRVREEGFSMPDYFYGLELLAKQKIINDFSAFCLPGVGNQDLIDIVTDLCQIHRALIITNESDLYDYLTD